MHRDIVLVITWARVPHSRYWNSRDVSMRAAGQCLQCGTREARVITDLLHIQLPKDLFECCVPQRDTRFLKKGHCTVSFHGRTL